MTVRRVLPIGMIMNQNQSDKGAPIIGGVGARTTSVRRHIMLHAARTNANELKFPRLTGAVGANKSMIIYLAEGNIYDQFQYIINGVGLWGMVSASADKSYVVIPNLTNETQYTVQVRGVNSIGKSKWSEYAVATPNFKKEIITTGSTNVSIPKGATVKYLIVAGGGGGAGATNGETGGGGGGGMVITNTFVSTGSPYTVTVGAGGAGGVGSANGENGANSSISGVITALGGGGGLKYTNMNLNGGLKPNYTIGNFTASTGGNGNQAGQGSTGGGGSFENANGISSGVSGGSGGAATTISDTDLTSGNYGKGGDGHDANSDASVSPAGANTGDGGSGAGSLASTSQNGGAGGSGKVVLFY